MPEFAYGAAQAVKRLERKIGKLKAGTKAKLLIAGEKVLVYAYEYASGPLTLEQLRFQNHPYSKERPQGDPLGSSPEYSKLNYQDVRGELSIRDSLHLRFSQTTDGYTVRITSSSPHIRFLAGHPIGRQVQRPYTIAVQRYGRRIIKPLLRQAVAESNSRL